MRTIQNMNQRTWQTSQEHVGKEEGAQLRSSSPAGSRNTEGDRVTQVGREVQTRDVVIKGGEEATGYCKAHQ